MDNYARWAIIFIIVSFVTVTAVLGVVFLAMQMPSCSRTTSPAGNDIPQNSSGEIAEAFLRNSSTFKFDGIPDSIKLVKMETLRCPYCWGFTFEFRTAHPGHGDRTGLVPAQVITDHMVVIGMQNSKVSSAICDGAWDMLQEKSANDGAAGKQ